jgi:hypothetical protein
MTTRQDAPMVACADERCPKGDALEHLVENQGCCQGANGAGGGRHPKRDADDHGVCRDAVLQHLRHRHCPAARPYLQSMPGAQCGAITPKQEAALNNTGDQSRIAL